MTAPVESPPRGDGPPRSATHGLTAACGLAGLLAALVWVRLEPFGDIAYSALAVMACTALAVFIPDLLWQRVDRRTLGLPAALEPRRVLVKWVGLIASIGFVALLYALFPEYHGDATFYRAYWIVVGPTSLLWPIWLIAALPYLAWVDRRMERPQDGLYELGRLACLQLGGRDWRAIAQHLLGWLVKGYFLPLMFTYFCGDLQRLIHYDLAHLASFGAVYDLAFFILYLLDVALVSMTYVMSLRACDTHIRSSEPTMFGWVVALACYQPFWSLISRQYLNYDSGPAWGVWMNAVPWLYDLWGCLIVALILIYVWATVSFGARFSNLTHRGIITNGPYRYSKHPAYLSKNLSWWLIAMPFMVDASPAESLRRCALLLLLNLFYYLRAKTEERHLALDPVYAEYMAWIDRRGVLRGLARVPLIGTLARLRLDDRALREGGVISPSAYRTRT